MEHAQHNTGTQQERGEKKGTEVLGRGCRGNGREWKKVAARRGGKQRTSSGRK